MSHRIALLPALLALVLAPPAPAQDKKKKDDRPAPLQLMDEGRLQEALTRAEAAVAANAKDAKALFVRGEVEWALGKHDTALASYEKAASLDADEYRSYAAEQKTFIAFYRAQDDQVRSLLETFEPGEISKHLPYLMAPDGLTVQREKKGKYIVHVDEGLRQRGGHVYAAKLMELIHDAYSSVFPFELDTTIVSRVYVFSTTAAYGAFNQKSGAGDMSDAAGYFDPGTRILVIDADPDGAPVNAEGFCASAIDTMFHEGFHQFVALVVPTLPTWFDEGMAEYFGPSTMRDKKSLNVGVIPRNDPSGRYTRVERIKETVRAKPPGHVPLRSFLTMSDEEFKAGGERELTNYAQAWSIFHFLLHSKAMSKTGKKLIKDYFTQLRTGKTRDEAFQASFGRTDIDAMEKAWIDYVIGM